MKCLGEFSEGVSRLNLARSIVSMFLEEIAFNLSKYGFINNGKQWLGAKKNQ
jgi:hypothetical protein